MVPRPSQGADRKMISAKAEIHRNFSFFIFKKEFAVKYILKIKYIGTAYCGFQCQKNGVAVQNVLTDAAVRVFKCPCMVTGCSRTDSGVHALGFCATVEPKEYAVIPAGKLHRAFSAFLPDDIAVVAAAVVDDSFHPRYSSKGKNYVYRIWDGPNEDPFKKKRTMRLTPAVTDAELLKMKAGAEHFLGRHDFSAFMAKGSKITDPVRCVTEAEVYRDGDGCIVFSVSADGFLYNMVRIMVGTLVDVARGRISPEDVAAVIESGDRARAGITAPPEGLYLNEVFYEEGIDWKCE